MVSIAHRPLTICQVLHSLHVGGAEVLAARLARQLGSSFRFVFACLDELGPLGQELLDEGFAVRVLKRRAGFDWKCPWRLACFLWQEKVDLVHAHQYTPFFYAMAARRLYRRPAVLFTEHGRHHPDHPRRKRMLVNRLLLEKRDRVVGVGKAVRQALVHNEGIPNRRVEVIYNGVNLAPFSNGRPDRLAIRQEIGVGAGDLVLLQVARLDYLKDHATALRTLSRLRQDRADARLVLVGDGQERGAIEELIQRLDLSANVRLLGLRSDVNHLLAAADVFLLSSISEGIPLTLIEAMAAGVPVVSTNVGGVPEVVEDSQTGLLAPAGDDAALAAQVLRLMSNPEWRGEIVRRARQRAQQLFSEKQMHQAYQKLYQEMLFA
ncbi:MAG TPA: glycosyltransferase [Gemmataceae bacterium]|nr:glycosyltransferase [Gemmataceae bacterium]